MSGHLEPSQIYGVPHLPAYQELLRRQEERREANKIAGQRAKFQEIAAAYSHLQPLPPQLPRPVYTIKGAPARSSDADSAAFFQACSGGNVEGVVAHLQICHPTAPDLAYALEEACQSFQLDVVRCLLQQNETELHYRCFRRCPDCPGDDLASKVMAGTSREESQSIFTSGSPKLLSLLEILIEHGWHPNQLLGPPVKGERSPMALACQDVALHYPRCLVDLDILRLLLDAGADPTIGREIYSHYWLTELAEIPVRRLTGDILERAVNMGCSEAVNLLISRGARVDHGIALHSLARRSGSSAQEKDVVQIGELGRQSPEFRYPTLSTRLSMAGLLLQQGEDIDRVVNVYPLMGKYCGVPTLSHMATALSHAKELMDWTFVRWLLENGADPGASPPGTFPPVLLYSMGRKHEEIDSIYQRIVEEVRQAR